MEQLEKFIKALGVPASVIDEAKKDGGDPEKAAKEWLQDRDTITKDQIKKELEPELKKTIGEETLKTVENSIKAKIKRDLNLTIEKSKELSLDDFLKEATEQIKAEKSHTDEQLKKQLEDYKAKYTEAADALGDVTKKLEDAEQDKIKAIEDVRTQAKAERHVDLALAEVPWAFKDNPARIEREVRIIREDVLGRFQIGEDGTIKAKDGGPALKPNNAGVYKTVAEFIEEETKRLELVEANGARRKEPGGGGGGGGADHKVDRTLSQQLEKEFAE